MQHNIQITWPLIAIYVASNYNHHTRRSISGGDEIISDKETSQGDSAAKTIYALGSLPLFDVVPTQSSKHAVYADDLSCAGKAQNFDIWWLKINKIGSKIGYFPKENKSWLIVKLEQYDAARDIFKEITLNITGRTKTPWEQS